MYRCYFDEENCKLYKSGYEDSFEEYVGDCLWNAVLYELDLNKLEEICEADADDIIKEIDGDDYYLINGEVLEEE